MKGYNILITGGTGSFGNKCTEIILNKFNPNKLIIYSRDELKQLQMQQNFGQDERLRFFIGDVRDKERLTYAFREVDLVIHAAALKQVPAAEYNPTECIKTNINGAENVIYAAIDSGRVKKVVALSTDKAASPINLYGATKLVSDKLFVSANKYAGSQNIKFSVVRYGNVIGSRGSVIPIFEDILKAKKVKIPLTHSDMTRFMISLDQGVNFVLKSFERMHGGEIFIPKIPSIKIVELAEHMAGKGNYKIVGIRPGEKIHEEMCPKESSSKTIEFKSFYVIIPSDADLDKSKFLETNLGEKGKPVSELFEYSSANNDHFMNSLEIEEMLNGYRNLL